MLIFKHKFLSMSQVFCSHAHAVINYKSYYNIM